MTGISTDEIMKIPKPHSIRTFGIILLLVGLTCGSSIVSALNGRLSSDILVSGTSTLPQPVNSKTQTLTTRNQGAIGSNLTSLDQQPRAHVTNSEGTTLLSFVAHHGLSSPPSFLGSDLLVSPLNYLRSVPTFSPLLNLAVTPQISISPTTGTLGVTSFTETYSGFTPNRTITENVTYPNGGLTVYHITANSNGAASSSFVLQSQSGNYSSYAIDDATGTRSNTITYTVNAAVNPRISISPTTGTLGVTSFTETYSGFTHNRTITENVTYPNGGLTVYHLTADSNGAASSSFVLQSQSGNYSSYAVDDATGTRSNTITYTVNAATLTGSLSPSNPIVGVTSVTLVGTATPGATVTDSETWPDGTIHSYTMVANGSGNWSSAPYVVPQLGTFTDVLRDSISGASKTITYSGVGDFNTSVNTTSRTVTAGQSTSYTVTFSSVSGFSGTIIPAALNWSNVSGATASWSPTSVTVPSNGSTTATFTIQTATSTATGTYSNIILQGTNGSFTRAASPVSISVNAAVNPRISISPTTGTLGVTNFTETYTGFTRNGTITENVTYPNGGLTVYHLTADANGSASSSFVLQSQSGNYSSYAVDDATGTRSSTITYAVSAAANPHISISPTTGTLGATSFTESYSGFTRNGTITENVTYPNGGLTVYHVTADGNGNASASFVLQSQSGNYSSYAIDDGTGTHSNTINYTANGTAHSSPTINSISPITPVTRNIDQDVAVYGSNFQQNLTVSVGFPGGGGTTLSGSQIGNITSSSFVMHITLNGAGTWSIRVNNPDGGQSSPLNLNVISANAVPTISMVQQATVVNSLTSTGEIEPLVAASTVQNLTVTGSNFQPALTVDAVFPTGQAITLQGPSQILNLNQTSFTLGIPLSYSGTYSIVVKNPDGGQSNSYPFTVGSFNSQTCSATLPARFSQIEGGWENDVYDHNDCSKSSKCRIHNWGCYMTSLAMALRYNGIDTDPHRLNQFMTANKGYTSPDGYVQNLPTIVSLISGKLLQWEKASGSSTQNLKDLLCNGFPVIVGVNLGSKGPGHFVLVTGMQGDKFLIADPLCDSTGKICRISDTSRTLDAYYKGDPNNWFRMRGYVKPTNSNIGGAAGYAQPYSLNDSADNSALNISVGDNAELLLIDPIGRRTGFEPITARDVEEIPNSGYFRDSLSDADTGEPGTHTTHSLIVSRPANGVYKLIVTGQDSGASEVSITSLAADGSVQPSASILSVTQAGSTSTYQISVGSTPNNTIQLMLDQSGPASDQASALDSVLFLRDPFPVLNSANLLNRGVDRNTRIIVFVTNLQLAQGESSSSIIVNLISSNNQTYDVPAEDVRTVPNSQFTQVIFRLPDNLSAGTCKIEVKAHGQVSNVVTIRIRS